MKTLIYLFAFSVLLSACYSQKKIVHANTVIASQNADGSSFEKAIYIKENSEGAGVDAEYAWLRSNYPGCRTRGQELVYHDKKPFDILHITTADGKDLDFYFDISNFLGKF